MAKVQAIREIPLKNISVGDSQVRVRDVGKDVDELAESIRLHGLLEPIVVHPTGMGRYEVLMGQRRLLAHRRLGKTQILALIVDQPVDRATAKTLSLTENLVRRALNTKDIIDACTALYKKYGSARAVAEETGLPYTEVLKHIKYDRLTLPLRRLVDTGEVPLDVALKAQDAASLIELTSEDATVKLAKELCTMTAAQRRQAVQARRRDPGRPVDDFVAAVTTGPRSKQIVVTLSVEEHRALQLFAKAKGITQDEAAAHLIADGLAGNGTLSEMSVSHRG